MNVLNGMVNNGLRLIFSAGFALMHHNLKTFLGVFLKYFAPILIIFSALGVNHKFKDSFFIGNAFMRYVSQSDVAHKSIILNEFCSLKGPCYFVNMVNLSLRKKSRKLVDITSFLSQLPSKFYRNLENHN